MYIKDLDNRLFDYEEGLYNDFVELFVENLINNEYSCIKYLLNGLKIPYTFRVFIKATFTRPQGEPDQFHLCPRYFYPYEEDLNQLLITEFSERIENLKMEQTGWTLHSFNEIKLRVQEVNIFPWWNLSNITSTTFKT